MKDKRQVSNLLVRFAILPFFLFFMGCQSHLREVERELSRVKSVKFPIDCRAEIILPLEDIDDEIVVRSGYYMRILNNSEALIDTAKAVFGKMFKEVDMRGKIENPHYVIKLKSDAEVDPSWVSYNVEVDCSITYGDERAFGSYKEKGDALTMVPEQKGLEEAYLKAFIKIVKQMTSDEKVVTLLAEGPDETSVRITTGIKSPDSEYQKLVDGVFTIELKKKFSFTKKPVSGNGSGFFIDNKGTALTNNHIVNKLDEVDSAKVLYKQKEYDFEVLAADEWNDLALIRVKELTGNPFLKLLLKNFPISVGDEVVVVGSPMGAELEQTVSKGIISSFREVRGYPLIQTDAAVNPGNSGGPLVHVRTQRVIGLVSLIGIGEGLGFAIPQDTIYKFLEVNKDKY